MLGLVLFIDKINIFFKRALLIYFLLFLLSHLFSLCFSFRLSQKEIDTAFAQLPLKPIQHQIKVYGKTIIFVEIGNDSLPIVMFLHGSPGSWSAFVEFMKDTTLLKKVKIVLVDRIGFG